MLFINRQEAGKKLAAKLQHFDSKPDTIVIGLPRGGVVVAAEVAKALHLPLDIIVTRKIGAPDNEELAIGAITEGGTAILDQSLVNALGATTEYINAVVNQQKCEAHRRLRKYRQHRPELFLHRKTVLLIDDGLATGYTILAAIASAKTKGAEKIIVAVPVASPDGAAKIAKQADQVVTVAQPEWYGAIGAFYEEFSQVDDATVLNILSHNTK